MIRENASYALVELLFQVENTKARESLAALDIYPEDGQVLMSARSWTAEVSTRSTERQAQSAR